MSKSPLLYKLQILIVPLFLVGKCRLAECQEYQTVEQRDIRCRHFLSGHHHPAVHCCSLPPLVVVHIHPRPAGPVPQTLQELPFLQIQVVLVLIQVDYRIGDLRHSFCKSCLGSVVDVRGYIVGNEKRCQ